MSRWLFLIINCNRWNGQDENKFSHRKLITHEYKHDINYPTLSRFYVNSSGTWQNYLLFWQVLRISLKVSKRIAQIDCPRGKFTDLATIKRYLFCLKEYRTILYYFIAQIVLFFSLSLLIYSIFIRSIHPIICYDKIIFLYCYWSLKLAYGHLRNSTWLLENNIW